MYAFYKGVENNKNDMFANDVCGEKDSDLQSSPGLCMHRPLFIMQLLYSIEGK